MKLSTLAIATFALTTQAAFAQSTSTPEPRNGISLYATLDMGLSSSSTSAAGYAPNGATTADKGPQTKLQDGGIGASNWGLKASRDLPNGMTAGFQVQGNLNLGNGALNSTSGTYPGPSSSLFNQIARITLSGNMGTLGVGRQITPLYYAMASTDSRDARYTGSILSALVGINSSAGWNGTTTNAPLGAIYDDNAIVYTSPKWHDLTANLEYVVGGVADNNQAANRSSATLQDDHNGLKLAAAYYIANDAYTAPTAATGGVLNNRFWHLGAKYDLGDWTFATSLSNGQNPSGIASGGASPASAASGTANYNITHFGVNYKISPTYRITTGYYGLQDQNTSANSSTMLAAGLDMFLDAQTMFYFQVGQVNNQGNMNMGVVYGQPVASGVSTTTYMVGARYSF